RPAGHRAVPEKVSRPRAVAGLILFRLRPCAPRHRRMRNIASRMIPARRIPRYALENLYPAHAVAGPGARENLQVTTTSPAAVARATAAYVTPNAGVRAKSNAAAATIIDEAAIASTAVRSPRVAESIGRPARRLSSRWRNARAQKWPGVQRNTRSARRAAGRD